MPRQAELVGRASEQAGLRAALAEAEAGRGGVVLIAGEAGVGKTRLAHDVLAGSGLRLLVGEAAQEGTPPHGPVVAALRSYLRAEPGGLDGCGPLKRHLALLLPELGPASRRSDPPTLLEALRAAFAAIGRAAPSVVLLDDLQWADETTLLDVLPMLAASLGEERLLVVGVYRSDEVPRGHPLRRLRRDLRRSGRLRELALEPIDEAATTALATGIVGGPLAPSLASTLYERTQGVPFFVEELAAALASGGRLHAGSRGLELVAGEDVPLPDTVREAILLRASTLSDQARGLLEVAAVAGLSVELEVVVALAGERGLDEAIDAGILAETDGGGARFRHALTREALYGDTPWTRRRALHRKLALALAERGARPGLVAEHWLGAHDRARASSWLAAAAEASADVHAYRDALGAGRRAIEIWPEGEEEERKLALLERIGRCAELCGELADAAAFWRELAERRRDGGDPEPYAEAERELATIYDLQGACERALGCRRGWAAAYGRAGLPAEAATELLAAAGYLDSAGSLGAALELVERASEEATRSGRDDLRVRALGIEGTVRAKLGEIDAGLAAARSALELALDGELAGPAADAYQRLANVLENAADYRAAWDAYQAGFDFCESRGIDAGAQVCLVCLAFILVHTGQWERAIELDRAILASAAAPAGAKMGAKQHLGLIGAARGETRRSRKLLSESGAYAERFERERMEVWDALGQAWLDEIEGADDAALERCRFILARWGESESLHYPVPALRWATTFCSTRGAEQEARSCAAALARLAASTTNREALAGLAHAVGEVALLDGDPGRAGEQFLAALELLRELELPFEAAQTQVRAGVALGAAGRREQAIERLTDAYRTARRLRAAPLAAKAAQALADLGEPVERRLGRRAAAQLGGPSLTRRETEVLRLVALGRTNREIAKELFLSTRTIDMHVRNILTKLRCRSRTEATRKAADLGLISEAGKIR